MWVIPVNIFALFSYRLNPRLCIRQEAFTTSQPLLVSEKAKKLCPTPLLEIEILH